MPTKKEKKLTLEQLIEKADAAKKANPLDLSSDQDLSIALMNLVSLEEHFFFSGGKTGKPGFYDMINIVREMRKDLMLRIVKKSTAENGEVWCISKHLLAASMRLMEVGTKQLGRGNTKDAHDLFNKAYDLYSLFWGINMDLIDLTGVQKIDGALPHGLDIWVGEVAASANKNADKKSKPRVPENKSLTGRLGAWVKNAVNCCLE
ncbi:MAG: hypothetical protein FWE50_04400 [Alphaproteobacteria bacterium]|nr:hypothetical protein [Alphaproteobacteria bacterium]